MNQPFTHLSCALNVYVCLLQVTYQTDLFLDKNIDYAVNEHQVLLNASKCPFVSSLFPPVEESAKSTKFTSIGSSFKVEQLLYFRFFQLKTVGKALAVKFYIREKYYKRGERCTKGVAQKTTNYCSISFIYLYVLRPLFCMICSNNYNLY
jgi:hypothetical protein